MLVQWGKDQLAAGLHERCERIDQLTHLGFGSKVAPTAFNRVADMTCFGDLRPTGATNLKHFDDISPHDANYQQYRALIQAILRRTRYYGLVWKDLRLCCGRCAYTVPS